MDYIVTSEVSLSCQNVHFTTCNKNNFTTCKKRFTSTRNDGPVHPRGQVTGGGGYGLVGVGELEYPGQVLVGGGDRIVRVADHDSVGPAFNGGWPDADEELDAAGEVVVHGKHDGIVGGLDAGGATAPAARRRAARRGWR